MHGRENKAAAGPMTAHEAGEHGLTGGIQRGSRFVQQPERALDCDQAGNREAAPLAGREVGRWQTPDAAEPDRVERISDCGLAAA